MELVSANTKNYLFITMSQFNEKNGLVRARVTMRRDQPFWEGGNSFIACESFRISSAPSQGGLYYKILPDTFYLGAVDRFTPTDHVDKKLDASWHRLETPQLISINGQYTPTTPKAEDDYRVTITNGLVTAATNTSLAYVDPDTLLPVFGEFWNDHGIQQDQPLRITTQAGVHLTGMVRNVPLHNINAPGSGPDGLFLPQTGDWKSHGQDNDHDQPPLLLAGHQGRMSIKRLGLTNLDADVSDVKKLVTKLLGKGAYFEIMNNYAGGAAPPELAQAGLIFMGPASLEVSGIPDLWLPVPELPNAHRQLRYRVFWDTSELGVGSTVYVKIPADVGPPAVAAHIKHGTVTALDPNWLAPVSQVGGGAIQGVELTDGNFLLTQSYKDWLNDPANTWGPGQQGMNALAGMLVHTHSWICTTSYLRLPDKMGCDIEFEFDPPSADTNNTLNQIRDFSIGFPITHFETIIDNDRVLRRIERRAAPRGENKYVYTPNELYWTFNNPQGGLTSADAAMTNAPYLLQTHENGGFKIAWDGTYSDFYMTVEMHDALGLNPYFEYNDAQGQDEVTEWDLVLQKDQINVWDQSYVSGLLHTTAANVYVFPATDPLTLVDPTAIAVGTNVCTTATDKWRLVSKQLIKTTSTESTVVRVEPTITNDAHNNPIYTWRNLPQSIMGNTQQISVESFGTFSGINIVIPNLPFQPMLGTQSDDRILASLRLPFEYGTDNKTSGIVGETNFSYYGDLLFNSDSSRSYLRITTDQQLYDCDVEARLIRRDGSMEVLYLPYQGQFEIKLRFLQTQ